ncbi:MAG: hypothetical protein IJ551_00015 [Prevotella sp.]|nr:hypothetical protein [Prevotella sp.]
MKKALNILIVCLLTLPLSGCWEDDELPASAPEPPADPVATITLQQDGTMHSFSYNGYELLASKPVNVFYYIPSDGDMTTMPILFIMPGESRDADTHLQLFQSWANQNKMMLFALQYATEYYATTTEYILGGMNTKQSAEGLLPREQWNFNYVETLFDQIKLFTHSIHNTYNLWGHSAGAQFVHRFVTFMPDARIGRAVACNSGWYTMPDLTKDFPYGFRLVSGADSKMQQKVLGRQLYVFVGGNDKDTAGLNTNAGSQEQGKNRNERARYYYQQSQQLAQQLGYTFNWQFQEVPGVAHDPSGMAQSSWHVLLP